MAAERTEPKRPVMDHVHTWFSLSYSNYAVLPRTLLQSMPDEWQERFVALIDELSTAYSHIEHAPGYEVTAGDWVYVNECTPDQLKSAGVTSSDDDPDSLVEVEAGVKDFPDGYETTYYKDGDELGPADRVFIAGTDPVPHYNRGRTYIEPKLEGEVTV